MNNHIDMNYFKGTPEQARLVAVFNQDLLNERSKYYPTNEEVLKIIAEHCGDTQVRIIDETQTHLVYLSIDSGVRVIYAINKKDFSKSTSLEY